MKVDILRKIDWVGGASFQPVYFDDAVFRMENAAAPGQRVPPHVHDQMSESFLVKSGEAVFWIGADRREVIARVGDRVVAPAGALHAFANMGSTPVVFEVEFRPSADMARMMAVIAGLQDDGERAWLLKYYYVERRGGLREFSRPVGILRIASAIMTPIVMLIGDVARWRRFIPRYL